MLGLSEQNDHINLSPARGCWYAVFATSMLNHLPVAVQQWGSETTARSGREPARVRPFRHTICSRRAGSVPMTGDDPLAYCHRVLLPIWERWAGATC